MDTKGSQTSAQQRDALLTQRLFSLPGPEARRVLDDKMITSKVKGALMIRLSINSTPSKWRFTKACTTERICGHRRPGRKAGDVEARRGVREVVNITVKPQGEMLMPTGRSTTGERGTSDATSVTVTTQPGVSTTITTTNAAPHSTDRNPNPSPNPTTSPSSNPTTNPSTNP
jgi:hypothetical protein